MYRVYAARPAGAHQPRHPPPPGAAAGQQPPPHRADERPAVLAARHAGHLLRRRDRHGRQHLPRRPQRRAHADAVERRTATPASRAPTRSSSILPVIIDPEYHYEAVNVEAQQTNPHSLLWWMRRIIALRKRYTAFGRGSMRFLQPDNRRSWPSCASTRTRRSSSWPTCRASRSGRSWTWASSRAACPWSSSARWSSLRSARLPTSSTSARTPSCGSAWRATRSPPILPLPTGSCPSWPGATTSWPSCADRATRWRTSCCAGWSRSAGTAAARTRSAPRASWLPWRSPPTPPRPSSRSRSSIATPSRSRMSCR